MGFTLDRRLWLTADRESVVEEGDPNAAFLLGSEGKEIPDEEAERLGLTSKKKAASKAEDKQTDAPANKASSTAKATKKA